MSTLDLEPIKERLAAATERLPEEARMDAYYYGFDRTGCGPVDAVLSAVAIAGKGSHNTDGWTNRDVYGYYDKRPGLPANPRIDDWTGGSAVELIQLTAKASAEKVKSLSDDLAALISEVERLRAERDGDGDVESGTLWHAQRDVSRLRNELHQIEALRRKAEIRCESLEAQIDAVREHHIPVDVNLYAATVKECCVCPGPWPCPTIRALEVRK